MGVSTQSTWGRTLSFQRKHEVPACRPLTSAVLCPHREPCHRVHRRLHIPTRCEGRSSSTDSDSFLLCSCTSPPCTTSRGISHPNHISHTSPSLSHCCPCLPKTCHISHNSPCVSHPCSCVSQTSNSVSQASNSVSSTSASVPHPQAKLFCC